jgi:hypothetical protein
MMVNQVGYNAMFGTVLKIQARFEYMTALVPVFWAVYLAQIRAVDDAVSGDPPHPALRDFLATDQETT